MQEGKMYAVYEYVEFLSPLQADDRTFTVELIPAVLDAVQKNFERQGYLVMWLQHGMRPGFIQTNITVSWNGE